MNLNNNPDIKIQLRLLEDDYFSLVLDWWNSSELQALRGCPSRQWIAEDIRHHYERSPELLRPWLIEIPGPQWIGVVELKKLRATEEEATVSIFIGVPGRRGKGLGEAALRQAVYLGFSDWKLSEVHAMVPAHNPAALRCFDKAGFARGETRYAHFDMGDRIADGVQYVLTRSAYLDKLQFS